jgi:Phage protein (N4 Gp49/phage Sf6 gene 66) family
MNDSSTLSKPHRSEAEPRGLTLSDIEASITSETYFTGEDGFWGSVEAAGCDGTEKLPAGLGLLTFCVLMLHNGTKIVGINYGAIDPAQHDAERGRREARKDATRQIWPLMGYLLREKLREAVGEASLAQQVLEALQRENITEQGRAALHDAFQRGDEARVRRLLSSRVMIDPSDLAPGQATTA